MSFFQRRAKGPTEFLRRVGPTMPLDTVEPPHSGEPAELPVANGTPEADSADLVAWTSILELIGREGGMTAIDISKQLGVSDGAVSKALQTMQNEALLQHSDNGDVMQLTEIGERAFKYTQITKM